MVKIKNKDLPKHEVKKLSDFLKEEKSKKQEKNKKLDRYQISVLRAFIDRHSHDEQPSEMYLLRQILSIVEEMCK